MSGPVGPWQRFWALPVAARKIILAAALSKFAAYLVWPFLAVILTQRFGFEIATVGLILSAALLVTILGAPVGGYIADRYRRDRLLPVALAIVAAAYAVMGTFDVALAYISSIIMISIANCLIEPTLRALLGEQVTSAEERAFAFHLRYYIVNLAVSAGPLAGVVFIQRQSDLGFLLAGACYVLLVILLHDILRKARAARDARTSPSVDVGQVLRALATSRMFLIVLALNLALVFCYAQSEDTLVFQMIAIRMQEIEWSIAILMLTNTCTVLGLHLIAMEWLTKLQMGAAFVIGCLFMAAGLLIIALNGHGNLAVMMVAMVLVTIAEFVVMPMITVLVDEMAPPDMRSSFFGVAMLPGLGAAAAPFLGALGITAMGGRMFYAVIAALCLPIGLAGFALSRGRGGTS